MWEGNQGFEIGDYLNAKIAFEKAEAIDSSNKELNYKLGMKITYLTIFPELFDSFRSTTLISRAATFYNSF